MHPRVHRLTEVLVGTAHRSCMHGFNVLTASGTGPSTVREHP